MNESHDSAADIAGADIINSATPLEHALLGIHPRLYAGPAAFDQIRTRLADPCYASAWSACLRSAETYATMTVEQYLRPSCWIITDIVDLNADATVRLYFHTGFPMSPDHDGAWTGSGKRAGLRIRSLSGCAFHYFEQETLDHAFRPLRCQPCLMIEQAVAVGQTVITTVVEAGPAGDVPRHAVDCRLGENTVDIHANGQSFRVCGDQHNYLGTF